MTCPELMDLGPEPSSSVRLYEEYSKELGEFTQEKRRLRRIQSVYSKLHRDEEGDFCDM